MFAIRVKTNIKNRPKTKRGHVWVNKSMDSYTTFENATYFEARIDAERHIREPWETTVDINIQ